MGIYIRDHDFINWKTVKEHALHKKARKRKPRCDGLI